MNDWFNFFKPRGIFVTLERGVLVEYSETINPCISFPIFFLISSENSEKVPSQSLEGDPKYNCN